MKEFIYKGIDSKGLDVAGSLPAKTQESAITQLREKGITIISLEEEKPKLSEILFKRKDSYVARLVNTIFFTRQLYSLVSSGVPIVQGIKNIESGVKDILFAKVIHQVNEQISSGMPLAKSLSDHPDYFSDIYVNVVRAGENSGQLELALKFMVDHCQKEISTINRIKSATRYPIFIIVTIFIVLMVVNIFVIPRFEAVFARFKMEIPLVTRIILGVSDFILNYWYFLIGGFIVVVFAMQHYYKTRQGRLNFDRLKLKMPIFGKILQDLIYERFCRTFAMLMQAGVPIVEVVDLVRKAAGNSYVTEEAKVMDELIQEGVSVSQAFDSTRLFSPIIIQMVKVGEQTGAMEKLLNQAADFYAEQADYALDKLSELIEPVLIIFLGGIVLVLAFGVFLPMWNMTNIAQG